MTKAEFREMIDLFYRIKRLMDKYNSYFEKDKTKTLCIPDDIFEEMCELLDEEDIKTLGIS